MASITKSNGMPRYCNEIYTIDGETNYNWVSSQTTNTITYEAGPKLSRGRMNWKECHHVWRTPPTMVTCSAISSDGRHECTLTSSLGWKMLSGAPAPSSALPSLGDCWSKIWDQIDLNTGDSVMLYSGILQAIPLIGGALKGVSLLNRAARRLQKDLRRKPFTTVVKSLIQGDFINRFVVQPTLDDMRKFADSFDYVVRTIKTAQDRNAELATAFSSELTNVTQRKVIHQDYGFGICRAQGDSIEEASATRQLFVLAKVTYDQCAIDPIKLWAKRVGLTKPLDSAWDMVPFSFVLDYFIRAGDFLDHVGNMLADQDALVGRLSTIFDVWGTTKCERKLTFKPTLTPYSSYWTNFVSDGNPIITSVGEFYRSRVDVMNEPNFWDRGVFDIRLSTTRYRTLAELFIQKKLR